MKLNIHTIIHPIIQKLAYEIMHEKTYEKSINTNNEKTLGMLIFYETLRKWLKIDSVYIKKVDILKKELFLNQSEKYLIITNIIECYNILSEVQKILPKTYLKHIDFYNKNNEFICNTKLEEYKIIIFEKFLINYNIIETINYLNSKYKINLSGIKIVCVTCNSNILKSIAQKYPYLNIYTTKII
nr:hypothetical protein [Gracilaria vermiculophylla]